MKRKIIRKLQEWNTKKDRKPLILKGVRQCGKTFSLRTFGEQHFERSFTLNLEARKDLHTLFEPDLNPRRILTDLSFKLNANINPATDLLVFDEIQACPNALTSLKYFSEELPQLAICSAGSLLGLELTPSSFPVGKVDFLTLHPMSFSEFLGALQDEKSLEILESFSINKITKTIHEYLWERFKWYLVTGGLPEVVQTFVNQRDNLYSAFNAVREKQTNLINAYYADIAKHAGKVNAMHIERVFDSVPRQLSKTQNSQAPRFQFSHIVPGIDRYQGLVSAIDWLTKAGLVIPTPIIHHAELPLNAYTKNNLFKLYCFDTGILGAMNQLSPQAILDYNFGTYKGYFAENFVAQHLLLTQPPHFYCWQKDRSEIEFIKQKGASTIPIEVKAGHISRAKSLDKYIKLYTPDQSVILNGALPEHLNHAKTYPIYCAEYLDGLLKHS